MPTEASPDPRAAYMQASTVFAQGYLDQMMRDGEYRALLAAARPYVAHAPQHKQAKAVLARIDKALGLETK